MSFRPMQFTEGNRYLQRQYRLGDDNRISYTTSSLIDEYRNRQSPTPETTEKQPIYPQVYLIENIINQIVDNCNGELPQEIVCSDGVIRGLTTEVYEELPTEFANRPLNKVQYEYIREGNFFQFMIAKVPNGFRIIKWNCEYSDQEAVAMTFERPRKKGDTRQFTPEEIAEILGDVAA